ncbi:N-acetylmuramidase family protein [Blastomonas sp. AAP53]|uniref:N-acetylmuramidase family protein n=1 Tax=Blastomonas sp. AAP53 TaxID=1248760 RepID=UPI0002D29376|nr:N-acetylmuramidase family protein [Blastomonas sp. AAP53]
MMDRAPVFSAIRMLRGGQSFTRADVGAIDTLLDSLGIARSGTAGPAEVKIGLSPSDFSAVAASLGCTAAQIRAVWEVESGGGWFKDVRADILALDGPGGFLDGPHLPKILFEAHIFDRYTEGKYRPSHPNLSSARWDRKLYVGGEAEYVRLWKAMALDRHAALLSASVGGAQIMGFNHKAAGFHTVEAFWDAMKLSEAAHLRAFASFITAKRLVSALRAISNDPDDCIAFARGYNGSGYAANNYHVKIADAHARHA